MNLSSKKAFFLITGIFVSWWALLLTFVLALLGGESRFMFWIILILVSSILLGLGLSEGESAEEEEPEEEEPQETKD